MLKLIGVFIVIVGFALKLDTIAVVLIAGLATGLVAGLSFMDILGILGKAFSDTRYMTLFVLTFPVIGICERYGLKEKSIDLIKNTKAITTGKILTLYMFIREVAAVLSIKLGGHPQFIRPLINPMAQGAAVSKYENIDEEDEEKIKGASAAMENYGNFYGQNVFVASPGVLLIAGTMGKLGYNASQIDVAKASIPIAILAFIIVVIQNLWLDRSLRKKYEKRIEGDNK
ncbi:DUF969 domain-containing protein [Clostridium sp. P21]|uniref:DUF969 domain-containing protein n=1 Tax=Clostridium muellerianum TaxID=2716538 RepID=A0A7Y0EF61_9CLOT|nr:DUF969 domain-containing protein [Clostridium muellerianum]NMM62302.1 DUF969 domain-containing protein [Clostridium muellerianum]